MNMLSVAIRRSVIILVIASSVIGIAVAASAAGECGGELTVDDRLLFGSVRLTTGTTESPNRSRARSSCQREPCRRGCDTAHSGRRAGTASRPAHTKSAGDGAEPVVGEAASGSLRSLVGAAAGAGLVHATVGAEAAFVGFYGGGAAGGVVGLVVSR